MNRNMIKLGMMGNFIRGSGIAKSEIVLEDGLPCIRYAEVYTQYGEVIRNPVSMVSKEGAKSALRLEKGDIIFPTSGETAKEIGKAAAFVGEQEAYVGGDAIVLRGHGQNAIFLAHALNSWESNRQKYRLATGNSVVHIYSKELAQIALWLPTNSEQEKIVEILSDCDSGISTISQEIMSKERSYKGVCQRAIESADETRPLTEVATVRFSNVDKKTYAGQQPTMLCNYTDVFYNDFITSDLDFMKSTASKAEIARFALQSGDVLFTKDSETPEEIAISAVVSENISSLVCGYHLGIARPKEIDGIYLGVAFKSTSVRNQFSRLCNGVTRFGLNLDSIHLVKIPILSREKQTLVAKISREHALEIDALSLQLALIKKLKRGLMQQLLTGRLRVGGTS
ncbi:hypothetical protein GN241_14325 [Rhodobacteraceae bacterium IMCC1335]